VLAHITNTSLLAAHRAVIIFGVQALVMNVVFGTIFLRLAPEQATLATSSLASRLGHALAVDATLVAVDAYVQSA
jgi:uncharacterized membrane protein